MNTTAALLDPILKGRISQRVSYAELLAKEARVSTGFLPYQPNGQVIIPVVPSKEPEIPFEVLEKARIEKLERETYDKAFAQGYQSGLEKGEKQKRDEINRLLPQLKAIIEQLNEISPRMFAASEYFLVETAVLLVQELLAYEVTLQPEQLRVRVERLLEFAGKRKQVVVRLAPENAELLQSFEDFSSQSGAGGGYPKAHFIIEADATLKPGTTRVESDFGGWEDNLGERLRQMQQGLRAQLRERLELQKQSSVMPAEDPQAVQQGIDYVETAIGEGVSALLAGHRYIPTPEVEPVTVEPEQEENS
ncbi:MAG: FliH/SctL family protein [Magnetococcus sp. DMHC-6]